MTRYLTAALAVAVGLGPTACRTSHDLAEVASHVRNDDPRAAAAPGLLTSMAPTASELAFEDATALQDALDDGMIATMLRYVDDCDRMADELEEYLAARRAQYEVVAASLEKIPWSARELPPDRLRWRVKRADDTVRKMTPASNACRVNRRVIAVMRSHFYMSRSLSGSP